MAAHSSGTSLPKHFWAIILLLQTYVCFLLHTPCRRPVTKLKTIRLFFYPCGTFLASVAFMAHEVLFTLAGPDEAV